MCFDPYVLERITASRLTELRNEAARQVALQSMRRGRPGALAALRDLLLGKTRVTDRRKIRPRPA
jgi:hypothetical protein